MKLKPIRKDLQEYLLVHGLAKKWEKASCLFEESPRHLSLNTELMNPSWRGVYSFRIDRKYRALFFITDGIAEVFQVTNHYKK
jgi:Txe/YoeB family toxin of Txe-Axe toxin-antitoxin module